MNWFKLFFFSFYLVISSQYTDQEVEKVINKVLTKQLINSVQKR